MSRTTDPRIVAGAFWGSFLVLSILAAIAGGVSLELFLDRGALTAYGVLSALVIQRVEPKLRETWARRALLVPLAFALGAAWSIVHRLSMEHLRHYLYGDVVHRLGMKVLTHNTFFYGMVLIAWAMLLTGVAEIDRSHRARERAIASEAEARRMELRALRYQLHPHFFFNTLNGISTLVLEGRNAEAATMIEQLSRFLRTTLSGAEQEERTLGAELDAVRDYLAIEHARLGERATIAIAAEPAVLAHRVPTLLLQPLVENAVRHGLAAREGPGRLDIHAARSAGEVVVTIENDAEPAAASREHIGLANVRARLNAWRGNAAQMTVTAAPGRWSVTIRFPATA